MRLGLRIGLGRLFFQTHPHFNMQLNGMFGVPPRRRALDRSLSGPCCLHGPVAGHTLDSPTNVLFSSPGALSLLLLLLCPPPRTQHHAAHVCMVVSLCFVRSLSLASRLPCNSFMLALAYIHPPHPSTPTTHTQSEGDKTQRWTCRPTSTAAPGKAVAATPVPEEEEEEEEAAK